MLDPRAKTKLAKSSSESLSRIATERVAVSESLADEGVKKQLGRVVSPGSISGSMKKAGAALMLSPDPLTDIPGIALIASSYFLKQRDPSSLKTLMNEARRMMKDIESIRF